MTIRSEIDPDGEYWSLAADYAVSCRLIVCHRPAPPSEMVEPSGLPTHPPIRWRHDGISPWDRFGHGEDLSLA